MDKFNTAEELRAAYLSGEISRGRTKRIAKAMGLTGDKFGYKGRQRDAGWFFLLEREWEQSRRKMDVMYIPCWAMEKREKKQ